MKASELTTEAARRRAAVVGALQEAGWSCAEWEEMFAAGFSLTPEALCELADDDREIAIGYHAEADFLTIQFESSDGDRVALRLYPERDAGELAAALAREVDAAQAGDSGQHLAAIVEHLEPLSRRMELETAEGIVPIE